MPRIEWDKTGERLYETGIDQGVHYMIDPQTAKYVHGVAWNGLTAVNETPSGAEANPQFADNIKYLNLYSAEEFGATIEAFTYPDQFGECDGSAELVPGVTIGLQSRKAFGFSYRTKIGNDIVGQDYGYKLHLIYGAMASPSEHGNNSINDSPEAATMSWEVTTTPVNVKGHKPTSHLTINSLKFSAEKMKAIEDILYGTEENEARMPLPDEVAEILGAEIEEVAG